MTESIPASRSITVYEEEFQLKVKGLGSRPSEDLIRLVARGRIAATEPGEAALDFGVGDGRHVEYLMSLGYRVTGTDVAPSSFEVTQRLFKGNDRFRESARKFPGIALSRRGIRTHPGLGGRALAGVAGIFSQRHAGVQACARARGPHPAYHADRSALPEAIFAGDWQEHLSLQDQDAHGLHFLFTQPVHIKSPVPIDLGLTVMQTLRYEYGSTNTEPTLEERMSFYGFCLKAARLTPGSTHEDGHGLPARKGVGWSVRACLLCRAHRRRVSRDGRYRSRATRHRPQAARAL